MNDQAPSVLGTLLLERFARKNPLAASLRFVLEYLFEPAALNVLFEANRDPQYTRKILFATIVEVMLAVVTNKVDSVHAALRPRGAAIGASVTAFYNKLNGTEPQVAEALVRQSAERGRAVLTEMGGLCAEPLPGWRLLILDGNHIAATERRLQVLWQVAAGPLPGLALVVFDVAARMMREVLRCEDGHAQERSLTARFLALVCAGDCWIADRNFCTTARLCGIARREAAFIIRHHAGLTIRSTGTRRSRGRTATGQLFEPSVTITGDDGKPRTLRRITLVLDKPTRDGETELHLWTNLPGTTTATQVAVSADVVAGLDAGRWTIETAFAELARWLESEIAPRGYPRAALLGFSVGVMAYNAIATLQGALRATHGEATVAKEVSGYSIAQFGRDAVGAIDDLLEPPDWQPWQGLPPDRAAPWLKAIAARIDLRLLRKARRGPKKPVPPRTRFKGKSHVSTKKLLDGLVEEVT